MIAARFFEKYFQLDVTEYKKVFRDMMSFWINGVDSGSFYVFQRDLPPAYKAQVTQK